MATVFVGRRMPVHAAARRLIAAHERHAPIDPGSWRDAPTG